MKTSPKLFFRLFHTLGLTGSLLATALSARAGLLVYEGFNYPDVSNLEGQTGGFGWADAWDFNSFYSTNVAGSLNYVDGLGNTLITSGGKFHNIGDPATSASSQPGRTLTNTLTDGGTFNQTNWMSFLAQRIGAKNGTGGPNGDPTWVRGANIALFNTNSALTYPGSEKLDIGENSNVANDCWMFRAPSNTENPGPVVNTVTTNSIGDVTLLVLRFDFVTNDVPNGNTTNDNVLLWLNPPLGVTPSDTTATTNIIGLKDFTFNRIRFFAGGNNGNPQAEWYVDELRIGDTFADVTPYTPGGGGGTQPRITNVQAAGGNVTLTLTGAVSTVYTVLGATNLTQTPWNNLGTATTSGSGVATFTDTGTLNARPQRFYRAQP